MVQHCCAIGCTNSADLFQNVSFHKFPIKNLPLLQKWVKAVRRRNFIPTRSTTICSDHFLEDDYSGIGKLLKSTAVPSIFNFEAANQATPKKILASESEITFLNPQCAPNSDEVEQPLAALDPINEKVWDPLELLGLENNKEVEVHFEDESQCYIEQPVFSNNSNVSCKENWTQTYFNKKCNSCANRHTQFRVLRQQVMRRDNKIAKMQELVTKLKDQVAESKKRKIKILGNKIVFDNLNESKSIDNVTVDDGQFEVILGA